MPAIRFTCSQCSQPLEAPEEAAGLAVVCPACQKELHVPEVVAISEDRAAAPRDGSQTPSSSRSNCAICLDQIRDKDAQTACPVCRAPYHSECWQENRGCAIYGCSQVPAVEQRQAIEIPVSYWGQENKPCPACGREILAAAKRCRYCGATFSSARPEDASEFRQRLELENRLPALRRTVLWLFLFCVLPFLAPIGAAWGAVWYPAHREELNALPSVYGALCKIGLGVAIGQAALLVLMGLLFAAFRGG